MASHLSSLFLRYPANRSSVKCQFYKLGMYYGERYVSSHDNEKEELVYCYGNLPIVSCFTVWGRLLG